MPIPPAAPAALRCLPIPLLAVLLLLSAAPAALAAPAPLAQALDAAWQRAVEARQAEGESRRAAAGKTAARSLVPEPLALELSQRDGAWYGDSGERETEAGIAIPLWLPGQRRARNAEADSDLAWAQANQDVARLQLAGQVRASAWTLAERQASHELAQAQLRLLRRIAEDVARRVRAGDLAPADGLAARAELLVAEAQAEDSGQQLQDARMQWRLLTGLEQAPAPDEPVPAQAAADARAVAAHPLLRRAELEAERARGRLDVLRRSRRDAPELTLGWRDERAEANADSVRSLGVSLRLPLGSRGRNEPLQAAAESEVAEAETALRLLRDRDRGERELARAGARASARQLEAAHERAALLRERAGLLEKAMSAGEVALVELLRGNAAAAEAELELSRQRAAHGLSLARLLQANGILP